MTQQVNAAEARSARAERAAAGGAGRDGEERAGAGAQRGGGRGRVRDQLHWSERSVSWIQEQLQRLEEQRLELHQRLESSAPHAQSWQDTHLPAAEEAVRSMLRVRAQLSATYRRLEELQLQVQRAEEDARPQLNSEEITGE